jgi:hypothetical protein
MTFAFSGCISCFKWSSPTSQCSLGRQCASKFINPASHGGLDTEAIADGGHCRRRPQRELKANNRGLGTRLDADLRLGDGCSNRSSRWQRQLDTGFGLGGGSARTSRQQRLDATTRRDPWQRQRASSSAPPCHGAPHRQHDPEVAHKGTGERLLFAFDEEGYGYLTHLSPTMQKGSLFCLSERI